MATITYTGGQITVPLDASAALFKSLKTFETNVESGKAASVKIGGDTYKFAKGAAKQVTFKFAGTDYASMTELGATPVAAYTAVINDLKTNQDKAVADAVKAALTYNGTVYASAAALAAASATVDITSDNAAAITAAVTSGTSNAFTSVADLYSAYQAAIAGVDITSDNAAAVTTAVTSGTSGAFTSVAALYSAYQAAANPTSNTSALTADADTFIGTGSADAFTGTSTTYTADDIIVDSSSADNDSLTITATGDITTTPVVVNVENIRFNLDAFGAAGGAGATTLFEIDLDDVASGSVTADVVRTGSSIAAVDFNNVITGLNLTTSSDFTTVTVTSDNDADYTLTVGGTTATTAVAVTDDGATADDVTIISTSALTITKTAADGDLALTAAGDIIITNADSATSLTATSTAGSITVTTADGATSLNLTAADEILINGATGATTVTVSAEGTGATGGTPISVVTATAATTLNASGNGAAVDYNAAASTALTQVNVTGSQNVTVRMSGVVLTPTISLDFNDNSTATSTLDLRVAGDGGTTAVDLVDVAADIIQLSADMNADDIDVASGANIVINSDQTKVTFDAPAATASTNSITLTVNDDAAAGTTGDLGTLIDFDNFKTVNLVFNDIDETTGGIDIDALNAGTATVNISGSSDLDINTSFTAGSLNAANHTGAIDIVLVGAATVAKVTTGSGADTIKQTTADLTTGGYTINSGAGNDSITLLASADSTVDGGDGTDTVALDGSYTEETISLTNVEILDVDTDATAANMRVDSSMLTGKSYIITDSTNGDNDLAIVMDGFTLDLSSLTIDDTTVGAIVIDGTTFGAAGGLSITGSSIADEVTGGDMGNNISTGDGGDTIVDSGDGNDLITLGAGDDTVTDAGAGDDTIDAGAGADTITTAGAGADSITGGEGADVITGGAGNDTIVLTESTAAADRINYDVTTDGVDTIIGFAAGSGADTVRLDADDVQEGASGKAGTAAGFGVVNNALVTGGATYRIDDDVDTAADSIAEITTTLDDDVVLSADSSGSDLLQALSSDSTEAGSITIDNGNDIGYILVYQNGNAYLFHYAEADNVATVEAAEITLAGVFTGITAGSFAAGDFTLDA